MIFNQHPPAQGGGGGIETVQVTVSIGKKTVSHIYYMDANLDAVDYGAATGAVSVVAAKGTILVITAGAPITTLLVSHATLETSAGGSTDGIAYVYIVSS